MMRPVQTSVEKLEEANQLARMLSVRLLELACDGLVLKLDPRVFDFAADKHVAHGLTFVRASRPI